MLLLKILLLITFNRKAIAGVLSSILLPLLGSCVRKNSQFFMKITSWKVIHWKAEREMFKSSVAIIKWNVYVCLCSLNKTHSSEPWFWIFSYLGYSLYDSLMTEFSWKRVIINLLWCLNTCTNMHLIHAAVSCGWQSTSPTVYRFAVSVVSHSQDRT